MLCITTFVKGHETVNLYVSDFSPYFPQSSLGKLQIKVQSLMARPLRGKGEGGGIKAGPLRKKRTFSED